MRILAIAVAPLKTKNTLLVGVVSKNKEIEGIVSTKVAVDGTDSTEKLIRLFKGTRFKEQVRLITMNGIGVAGLNVLDIWKVEKETGARVLSVTRKKPHPNELVKALKLYSKQEHADVKERIAIVNRVKKLKEYQANGFYCQATLPKSEAAKFVAEAVRLQRLAHLIASGVTRGESKGRI